jgi:hypothetical protein
MPVLVPVAQMGYGIADGLSGIIGQFPVPPPKNKSGSRAMACSLADGPVVADDPGSARAPAAR